MNRAETQRLKQERQKIRAEEQREKRVAAERKRSAVIEHRRKETAEIRSRVNLNVARGQEKRSKRYAKNPFAFQTRKRKSTSRRRGSLMGW